MGGYNAGEVASGIAVKTVLNLIREQVAWAATTPVKSRAASP